MFNGIIFNTGIIDNISKSKNSVEISLKTSRHRMRLRTEWALTLKTLCPFHEQHHPTALSKPHVQAHARLLARGTSIHIATNASGFVPRVKILERSDQN